MILKGEWKVAQRDEIAHLLLNMAGGNSKISILSGPLGKMGQKVEIVVHNDRLRSFSVNGRQVKSLWRVKGALLKVLESEKSRFHICPVDEKAVNGINLPFPALLMDVIATKDHIRPPEKDLSEHVLRLRRVPEDDELRSFFLDLRKEFKNDVKIARILSTFKCSDRQYVMSLIDRLVSEGYAILLPPRREESPPPAKPKSADSLDLNPLIIGLISFMASAISGALVILLMYRFVLGG